MSKKRIVVIADTRKEEVNKNLPEIRQILEKFTQVFGYYTLVEDMLASISLDGIKYIIVFGGDGLLLATARLTTHSKIPIIGVNFGRLGFLTEFNLAEFFEQIENIFEEKNPIASYMLLQCEIERKGEIVQSLRAVNDVVIKTPEVARMFYTSLFIDNEEITTYGGDGVIFSTPIGSTAYSLSAGGPIVSPDFTAVVITPICPHTLTLRSLVVGIQHQIKIGILPNYKENVVLCVDGQVNVPLLAKDQIHISRAKESFYLVKNNSRSFYRVLQEKLAWGEGKFNLKNSTHSA